MYLCVTGLLILPIQSANTLRPELQTRGCAKCDVCNLQIQTAGIFLVGCPACNQNFKHFFCTITCSADQSLFTNVTSAQKAYDNNRTVVEAINVFVSDTYGQHFYNSCKVSAQLLFFAPQYALRCVQIHVIRYPHS